MKIDFNKISVEKIPNFKGGEKEIEAQMYFDGLNRIMKATLHPGASIGMHLHENSSEIIFISEGKGVVLYDNEKIEIQSGECHYCPLGHSHSLINNSKSDLSFTAIVPMQNHNDNINNK